MAGLGGPSSVPTPGSSGIGHSSASKSTAVLNPGGFGVGSTPAVPKPQSSNISQLASLITGPVQQQPQRPAQPMVNSSTTNPTIDNTVLPTLLERAKGGMGADTAIRLAQGASRDQLSGIMKENAGNAARRGAGGSGAENMMNSAAIGQSQRSMAKQASDISYGAEQDRNALYKDIAGIASNSDQMQNEQRRLGLSQWQAQKSADLEQQRINQSRDDRLLSILTQALF